MAEELLSSSSGSQVAEDQVCRCPRFVILLPGPKTYKQEVMVPLKSGPKPDTGKLLHRGL